MLTSADGQPGRKPWGRRACLEEPSRVAGARLPRQHPTGGGRAAPGQGRAPLGLPGDVLIQGHPSALSWPWVGLPQGRNLSKDLKALWYYFCEQWLCLECMKVRLAPALYPAISACDTAPVACYSDVLRLHKYCTESLKHSFCIFSASQKRGLFLWRFLGCHF